MGNGNIDVGNKTATRKPGQPIIEPPGAGGASEPGGDKQDARQRPLQNPLKAERPKICGAMSQQRGDSGCQSAPQKFVQLVGCRDPNARPEPWVRPAPLR